MSKHRALSMRLAAMTLLAALFAVVPVTLAQRRVTPVNTPATRTQPHNDAKGDTLRALERRKARSTSYVDDRGVTIFVDTVTGTEWVDSLMLPKAPPMIYPLLHDISVGLNVLDPVLRATGQRYGGADAWLAVSLHNRYIPTFEAGIGGANSTPDYSNFTYVGKAAPYFRLGADYNFLYNSNPDYRFTAGLRYGFSHFRFAVNNVTANDPYWGQTGQFNIPSTACTAGWAEFVLGLRVQLWRQWAAGWTVRYRQMLHCTSPATGDPWYIPGYGTNNGNIGATFSVIYTIPFPTQKNVQDSK